MSPSVTIDRDGLHLNGEPFYLLAGCLHYFRWPRAEWRPLLEQAHWAGLNTIDTVIPWNRHEPHPGVFDFADEADLGAFLDLCHELGLKVIVRPGPYICAEWENGGLPAWLSADPSIRLRVDSEGYLGAALHWFDQLLTILVPRQYPRGGPIILCQIENEHWASGVYGHDAHQQTLARALRERGIEVPLYTCMGATPGWPEFRNGWSGIAEKLVQTRSLWPDNPMIVSELWSGWFDSWGASLQTRKTPAKLDMTLHQLTAVGCAGFSHWMWAGGTNFGFWGGRTVGGDLVYMTASYDYDAPVSEYGELRAKALVARRHHLFLGSLGAQLAPVLANAVPGGLQVIAPAAVSGRSEGGAVPYRTVRAGPNTPAPWHQFQASFLFNPGLETQSYQVFLDEPARHLVVEVEPASIRPIFARLPLAAGIELVCHSGRILGCWHHADHHLLIVYGPPGEQGELELALPGLGAPLALSRADAALRPTLAGQTLQLRYRVIEPGASLTLHGPEGRLLLHVLSSEAAAHCSILPDGSLHTAPPAPAPRPQPIIPTTDDAALPEAVLGVVLPSVAIHNPQSKIQNGLSLPLERLAVDELSSDTGWHPLAAPLPLEQLGCDRGYGWYRAELELAAPLEETLIAPWLSDRAHVFMDGTELGVLGVDPAGPRYALPLRLDAGRHELRILADNLGRFNYGSGLGEAKGLRDTLYLGGAAADLSAGWVALWQEAVFAGETIAGARPASVRPDAADVHLGHLAFSVPSLWLLRTIDVPAGHHALLHLSGDRSSGALFVNGVAIERFSRHRSSGPIKRDITALLRPGQNVLALNLQGYGGAPWRATLVTYDASRPLPARWSFRDGVSPGPGTPAPSGPAFYRARFAAGALRSARTLRLVPAGLHKGQIWLNGRNLARFWQIGPQEAYKLPPSWLHEHNELLIFAETGHAEHVTLLHDENAP